MTNDTEGSNPYLYEYVAPTTIEAFYWDGGVDSTTQPRWFMDMLLEGRARILNKPEIGEYPRFIYKGEDNKSEYCTGAGVYILKDGGKITTMGVSRFHNEYAKKGQR